MFDTIADMLRGSAPDDLAHALGTDRTQTRRAMEIGLPALITGLRDKTLEPGGAASLAGMLGDESAGLPTDVGAYLGEGDPSRGAAMLDVAFGDRGEPALAALASASGLSTRLLAQVMSVLAPLATGVLGGSAPSDPEGLRSYLAGAVDDLEGKGFGRVVELVSPDDPVAMSDVDMGVADVETATVNTEVIDVAGPAELDVVIDDLVEPDMAAGFDADTIEVGDDLSVADPLGAAAAGTVVEGAFPDAANDLSFNVPEADLPDVEVPDFGAPAAADVGFGDVCLLYTSPSPRDATLSRMPSSA